MQRIAMAVVIVVVCAYSYAYGQNPRLQNPVLCNHQEHDVAFYCSMKTIPVYVQGVDTETGVIKTLYIERLDQLKPEQARFVAEQHKALGALYWSGIWVTGNPIANHQVTVLEFMLPDKKTTSTKLEVWNIVPPKPDRRGLVAKYLEFAKEFLRAVGRYPGVRDYAQHFRTSEEKTTAQLREVDKALAPKPKKENEDFFRKNFLVNHVWFIRFHEPCHTVLWTACTYPDSPFTRKEYEACYYLPLQINRVDQVRYAIESVGGIQKDDALGFELDAVFNEDRPVVHTKLFVSYTNGLRNQYGHPVVVARQTAMGVIVQHNIVDALQLLKDCAGKRCIAVFATYRKKNLKDSIPGELVVVKILED